MKRSAESASALRLLLTTSRIGWRLCRCPQPRPLAIVLFVVRVIARVADPHAGHASTVPIIAVGACAAFRDGGPMIFYEIPYEQGNTKTWHLDGLAEGRKNFDSRVDALAFAMKTAKAAAKGCGDKACIAIQGADGSWRTFDPDMLPLK